jgi:hypothetical protein
LLDGTNFLLLDGTDFQLLGNWYVKKY